MQMMNRNNNNNIINKNCYMTDNNPYSVNNRHYASTKFWTSQRRPIDGRKCRNEYENFGNVMASGGDGTRFGKMKKNKQFRNRNYNNVNRYNNGGGVRFQPYVTERKERVMANPAKTAVAAADVGNLLATSVAWGEVEEWGLDVYGTMSGLIRLRSDSDDDGAASSCCSEENFERRLSKYEIILPKSVSGAGVDMKTIKSRGEERSRLLENENVMMKQSLCVMDKYMDDLKRRMDAMELQFRAKVNKDGKENRDSNDAMLMKDFSMVPICA